MKKILVLSDTHGVKMYMNELVPMIKEDIDLIIHAGDHYRDSVYLYEKTGVSQLGVLGNCDFEIGDRELVYDIEGVKIFLTHGHRYDVKRDISILAEYAKSQGANIAIFGHTHVKESRIINGVQMINPGSLAQPRDGMKRSYVILEIDNGKFEYKFELL